ncbi:ParB family protein, partial [Pseudokineococcus sp. 1T1Z-3]|uniref:ParB family protein n=1 Tax=Pseudokineococcus sp. 1T1Z-3 TaxID=3132745 RepID=UPI0030B3F351
GKLAKAAPQDPVIGTPQDAPAAGESTGTAAEVVRESAGKRKVGYAQDADDTARARAAYNWTRANTGTRSFSDFIANAVMAEVERLEKEYNGGKAWAGMHAGEIPTGRPLE